MDPREPLSDAVATVMSRIAAGDQRATWDLHSLAEPSLRAMLRGEARRVGAWINDEDIYDLTLDAAIVLGRLAGSWRPGGALPWVWARPRMLALVHDHIGTFTRELDDSLLEIEAPAIPAPIDDPRAALRALAVRYSGADDLDCRLAQAVTDRDAQIWLGFLIERATGNRSPAVTVAADHGMQPAAVRKVVQRVGQRLGPVAAAA